MDKRKITAALLALALAFGSGLAIGGAMCREELVEARRTIEMQAEALEQVYSRNNY